MKIDLTMIKLDCVLTYSCLRTLNPLGHFGIVCDIYGDRPEAKVTQYKERGKIQPFTSISHGKETDIRVD